MDSISRILIAKKIKDNSISYKCAHIKSTSLSFLFLIFLEYQANVGNQYCTLQKYVTHYNSEAEIHLVKMVCK